MRDKQTRYVVLGFPRSGTTLLARLLNGHRDISCPPETYAINAAGKFLSEQSRVEGPHIGVLSGLGLLGFEAEDVMQPLRDMVFGFQDKIAGERPIWIEKTAANIFQLEALEPFLVGHVRFICITRNPLDVVASNMDLADTMGAQLSDLYALTRSYDIAQEGVMRAWVERTQALDAFTTRHAQDCHTLRYEDLLEDPVQTLGALMDFIGVETDAAIQIEEAFEQPSEAGLGDFRIDETKGIRPPQKDGWRKRLPNAITSRIVPIAAEVMAQHGYTVPKTVKLPDRETAIRQFQMSVDFKRNAAKKT